MTSYPNGLASPSGSNSPKRLALGRDALHQIVPGLDERFGPLFLKLGAQSININAGLGKLVQDPFTMTAVRRHDGSDTAVISEGDQRFLRHRVHRQRGGQRLDVEGVGCLRVLGAGAGPEQPLGPTAGIVHALPPPTAQQLQVRLIDRAGNSNAELVAQSLGSFVGHCDVPAADEY